MTEILDPQEGEVICDPTCGSGGFLIKAFEYVREKIEADIRSKKDSLRLSIEGNDYDALPEDKQVKISHSIDKMQAALNTELDTGIEGSRMYQLSRNSVTVQQQILDAYHAKLDEADENIRKGNNYSDGLLLSVQADVSDLKNKTTKNTASSSILQIIPFTSTIRWEVDYIQKKGRLETIYNSFKYQEYCINDLQKESLFGLSVKASLDKKNGMIPVLRMSNVINGELDFSTLKYLPADCASTEKEPQKWILRKGDFLITRTNGSKDLIGKAAIFNSDETYTYILLSSLYGRTLLQGFLQTDPATGRA